MTVHEFPVREAVRDPGNPLAYRADDVDEAAAGQLAVLEQIRERLVAKLGNDPTATAAAVDVVDEYAAEILYDASGWEDDDQLS